MYSIKKVLNDEQVCTTGLWTSLYLYFLLPATKKGVSSFKTTLQQFLIMLLEPIKTSLSSNCHGAANCTFLLSSYFVSLLSCLLECKKNGHTLVLRPLISTFQETACVLQQGRATRQTPSISIRSGCQFSLVSMRAVIRNNRLWKINGSNLSILRLPLLRNENACL